MSRSHRIFIVSCGIVVFALFAGLEAWNIVENGWPISMCTWPMAALGLGLAAFGGLYGRRPSPPGFDVLPPPKP